MSDFCPSCGENPLDNDSKECTKCHYISCKMCIHSDDMCIDCYNNLCPNCLKIDLTGDYNKEKYCSKCDKIYCINCIAATGCQTINGECINCFNYICENCHQIKLPKNKLYLFDSSEDFPMCDDCKTNICT